MLATALHQSISTIKRCSHIISSAWYCCNSCTHDVKLFSKSPNDLNASLFCNPSQFNFPLLKQSYYIIATLTTANKASFIDESKIIAYQFLFGTKSD